MPATRACALRRRRARPRSAPVRPVPARGGVDLARQHSQWHRVRAQHPLRHALRQRGPLFVVRPGRTRTRVCLTSLPWERLGVDSANQALCTVTVVFANFGLDARGGLRRAARSSAALLNQKSSPGISKVHLNHPRCAHRRQSLRRSTLRMTGDGRRCPSRYGSRVTGFSLEPTVDKLRRWTADRRHCKSTAVPASCSSNLWRRRPKAAFSDLGDFTVPANSGPASCYEAYRSVAKKWQVLPPTTNRCQTKCA